MPTMQARNRPARAAALALAALAALAVAWPRAAEAKRRKKPTYVFLVTRVELEKGVPAKLEAVLREKLAAAIEEHAQLEAKLDEDAPDPEKDPKAFERYLKKKRISAYKVNVEVIGYERTVEDNPNKSGNVLTVHVALRLFGETMPKRVMAFTGDGSATIKLETGKTVRSRDDQVAHEDATELAVADAVAVSLRKLERKRKGK